MICSDMHRLRTISSIMRGLNNKSITIHFQDQSGAASLRCKNRAEISDPFVNRSPIRLVFVSAHKLSGIV